MDIRLRIWPQYVLEWTGGQVSLTPNQGVIVSRLFNGRATTYAELTDSLYSTDPEGGPDDPNNSIAVTLCKIRKKLKSSPVEIRRVRTACVRFLKTIDGVPDNIISEGKTTKPD
jgi:hypothetical protein